MHNDDDDDDDYDNNDNDNVNITASLIDDIRTTIICNNFFSLQVVY